MRVSSSSQTHGIKVVYLFGFAVVLIVALFGLVTFSASVRNTGVTAQGTPQCPQGPVSPAAAPVSGYQYFVDYNTTDGAIMAAATVPSCNVGGELPSVPPNLSEQVAVLNVTASPVLSSMMPNGYLNAYYVNLHTMQLTVIPGISFVDNYHALYNGQPITNGTRIPVPN